MDNESQPYQTVSPFYAGLTGRCPRCGKGSLFDGFLRVASRCKHCGLDFAFADSGDGPVAFITLVAGFIVCGAALLVEVRYAPPMWVHAALWLPLGIGVPLAMMRPSKALMLALQYKHNAAEGRRASED
jgi:uncharacterized protein (DUF983 family)